MDNKYRFSVPVKSDVTPRVLSPVVILAPVANVIGFDVFATRCLIPVTPCASRAAMKGLSGAAVRDSLDSEGLVAGRSTRERVVRCSSGWCVVWL